MTIHAKKFNQTPAEAIAEMRVQLLKMRAEPDRDQLKDVSADDAFEIGYEYALFDYDHLTGPNPVEINLESVRFRAEIDFEPADQTP